MRRKFCIRSMAITLAVITAFGIRYKITHRSSSEEEVEYIGLNSLGSANHQLSDYCVVWLNSL